MRVFLLAVFLISGWGMAQSSAPSLAELSKQTRERKAKGYKPAPLFTNADLKNFENAPVSVSEAAEEGNHPEETKAAAVKAPASPDDAEYAKLLAEWRPKFQAAVIDYKNAVNRGLVLKLRLNYLYNSTYHALTYDVTPAMFLAAEFERTAKEVESNKEEVARAEKAIEALKVEARAAGVKEGDSVAMVGELPKPTIPDV
ncbi:MAG: hypothetical protein EHM23_21270 [Acidobacteria bacterium]|nr:MAG: hypothetical protein EHM23_21270 [Acidobacteriota bacterium]